MASRTVTLSDVAKVAGVSLSTASKALSGNDRVSEATRARIKQVAQRLDFQPNALAQSFARGRSQTIGILTQNAAGTFSAPVLVGAAAELGGREQAVLLYDAEFDGLTLDASVRRLQARRIDGLLVIGNGPHERVRSVTHAFGVPVAYAFTLTEVADDVAFLPDNHEIGRLAGEHLVATGRRKVALLSAASEDPAAAERARGLRAALDAAGLPLVAALERHTWWESTGTELALELLASGAEVDAIFCGNDHMARGAERVLTDRGVRVPDDVALVGVDNWEGHVIGQGTQHLTTVDTGLTALGATAAAHLLSGEQLTGRQVQPVHLVQGDTT